VTRETPGDDAITICMVTPSFFPVVGGLETQVERQIPFLRQQGVNAWVVTRQSGGLPATSTERGIRVLRIPVPGGAALRSLSFSIRGTLAILRHRRHVDVLHAHSIMSPTTIATLAGVVLRRPRVVTLHARYELDHLLSKPFGTMRLQLFRRVIHRFVAINDDIADLLRAHDVPDGKIVRIRNGIDTSRFRPVTEDERRALRRQRNLPVDQPIAVFVGRLHAVKQVDVLLRAWANVECGHLAIVGDGDERRMLEGLTHELDLESRVTFAGMVNDVDAWVGAADIFVLPSASEGLSVALLEAMSSGVVPVATAVGGAVDLIQDGVNGYLVEPGEVGALAAALNEALASPAWRARAANMSRESIVRQFDLSIVAHDLASMYREVLNGSER
jgi:glycosyltransferase involved in cell wall biosynthesis